MKYFCTYLRFTQLAVGFSRQIFIDTVLPLEYTLYYPYNTEPCLCFGSVSIRILSTTLETPFPFALRAIFKLVFFGLSYRPSRQSLTAAGTFDSHRHQTQLPTHGWSFSLSHGS